MVPPELTRSAVEVEAYVASWIEISNEIDQSQADGVEAYVASWIEI